MRTIGGSNCIGRTALGLVVANLIVSGCVSTSSGPQRLYAVEVEASALREELQGISLAHFSRSDEPTRFKLRNDMIAARMYAIDLQYTSYEATLTKERQGVGFGAAATTLALTTASGLVTPVATKNLLTAMAGFVTGSRAAYDNDILLAHSMQWIQSQMQARRADVAGRMLRGMKLSTVDYPLAAALSDLEAYYRAGTFTGGLIATAEVIADDAQSAEAERANAIEVSFVSNASTLALQACLKKPGARAGLLRLMARPSSAVLGSLTVDKSATAEAQRIELLSKGKAAGIC